jgi:protein tyrosine phosphatase
MPKTSRKSHKHSRKNNSKLHKPNHIIKGGVSSVYKEVFYKPNWIEFFGCQWTTLVKLKGTCLYATSIPDQNTHKCLATFLFYMFVKDIYRIISLQGCDVSNPKKTENCEGFTPDGNDLDDKSYESRMWIGLGNSYIETQRREFKNHKIEDFTAGNLRTWLELLNYNYYIEWEKTIIHCLAGFGRTGSILLMVYMNTYYQNNRNKANELNNEFFHYSSSSELYTELRKEFSEAIELDIDVVDENDRNKPSENGEVNNLIKSFDKNKIVHEVFCIEDYSDANTLITRMNYIRICLGTKFKQDTIFLFQLMPMPIDLKKRLDILSPETLFSSFQAIKAREQTQLIAITPETIFSSEGREPVQINLSDIATISAQVDNPYGITA